MRLYLVQHGEARSEAEDPERSLTIRGEEETKKISDAAKRLGIRPSRIYHSGKKRAEQTAGIIAGASRSVCSAWPGAQSERRRPSVGRADIRRGGGPYDCRPPAVPGKACVLSCLRRRRGKGSEVSIQRHRMFGKERVRKVGSGPGDQTGSGMSKIGFSPQSRRGRRKTDLLFGGRPPNKRVLLCDQIPIQSPVLDGFGEVGGLYIFLVFEVGNGPGDL